MVTTTIIAVIVGVIVGASLSAIFFAPYGWEDRDGFHYGKPEPGEEMTVESLVRLYEGAE